ncbi:MAG: type II/IV secretion system ATPase subunit [Sulfolobaceae archaeon]|nr:type II/IV secretion system ATPase subunit [Sulfolobaceae archaeon]
MSETILEEYYIGPAKVIIKEVNNSGYYIVEEPTIDENTKQLVDKVINELYTSNYSNIEEEIVKRTKEAGLPDTEVENVLYIIRKRLLYDKITIPMLDPNVEEIECKGYKVPITVIHRKYSEFSRLYTNIIFDTDDEILKVIEKLAEVSNKAINIARPYMEFTLPEGHRVAATISNEISLPGSTFDIRKFPTRPLSIVWLLKNDMLNELIAAYLWFLLDFKPFLIIVGPTGSGKTTLLNALLGLLNPVNKIITIEDVPEINILSDNRVRFFSRETLNQEYNISLLDLARLSLRYRPDYLVIGEVRGKEIEALIHAALSGHGSITTFHGSSPEDVVTRVTSLLNPDLANLFLQSIWGFIIVGMYKNKRRILRIYEITKSTKYKIIFEYSFSENKYKPDNIEKVIKESTRLRKIGKLYGYSINSLKEELEKRMNFLIELKEKDISDFNEIQLKLKEFYRGKLE